MNILLVSGLSEIFVLAPANTEELTELVDRKDFFNDLPIILILPQHDQATIHSGHLLMPRFLIPISQV